VSASTFRRFACQPCLPPAIAIKDRTQHPEGSSFDQENGEGGIRTLATFPRSFHGSDRLETALQSQSDGNQPSFEVCGNYGLIRLRGCWGGGMKAEIGGPDQYWSEDLPPTRGQWRDLAEVALLLLGVPKPESRLDATVAMVRLRAAATNLPPVEVPEPW
jgi:hypothetical protein